MADSTKRLLTDETGQDIVTALNAIAGNHNVSDAYDSTKTYAVGDMCIYNNTLYKCKTAINTAEAWNSSHWNQVSVGTELTTLNNQITYTAISSGSLKSYTGDNTKTLYYKSSDISQFTDIPSEAVGKQWPFVLEVVKMQVYAKQILHIFADSTNMNNPPTYVRQQSYKNNAIVWGNWCSLNNQIENDYAPCVDEFVYKSTSSFQDNVEAGQSKQITLTKKGIYRLYIQTNTSNSTGQSVTIQQNNTTIVAMRTNGIQYQNEQVFVPIKAGVTLTVNAPAGSAVQYQIQRYTD